MTESKNIVDIDKMYENLRNAIILMAVEDYQKAKIELQKPVPKEHTQSKVDELIRFFKSDFYYELTNIDGTRLLKQLDEMSA